MLGDFFSIGLAALPGFFDSSALVSLKLPVVPVTVNLSLVFSLWCFVVSSGIGTSVFNVFSVTKSYMCPALLCYSGC